MGAAERSAQLGEPGKTIDGPMVLRILRPIAPDTIHSIVTGSPNMRPEVVNDAVYSGEQVGMNRCGAVAVMTRIGWLGVKPDEMEWLTFFGWAEQRRRAVSVKSDPDKCARLAADAYKAIWESGWEVVGADASKVSPFNDEQRAYMRALDRMPDDQRCFCGWYSAKKCPSCRPDLTFADALRMRCPLCRTTSGIHVIGCMLEVSPYSDLPTFSMNLETFKRMRVCWRVRP